MRALLVAVVLGLLIVPGVTAGWTEYRGAPDRSAVVELPAGPFDVTASSAGQDLSLGDGTWGPLALDVGERTLVASSGPDGCRIHELRTSGLTSGRVMDDCSGPVSLQTYAAPHDLVYLCTEASGGAPILHALDAGSLQTRWTLDAVTQGVYPVEDIMWGCRGVTYDSVRDALYFLVSPADPQQSVTFPRQTATTGNFISADPATGEIRWSRHLAVERVFVDETPLPIETYSDTGVLYPQGLALANDGIVVTALKPCGNCGGLSTLNRALSWMSFDGSGQGAGMSAYSSSDAAVSGTMVDSGGSAVPATDGRLSATVVGDRLVIVDVDAERPAHVMPLEDPALGKGIQSPPPSWTGKELVVPLPYSVRLIDPATFDTVWEWGHGPGWRVVDHIVSSRAESWVVLADERDAGSALIARLDLTEGRLIQLIPLPGGIRSSLDGPAKGVRMQLVPTDEGLTILAGDGIVFRLAPSEKTTLDVSDRYPSRGDSIVVTPSRTGSEVEDVVVWGDGTSTAFTSGAPMEHVYRRDGDYDITVTTVYADGLTRTAVASVHVGAQDPSELTFMQKAFAPGNQDMAWGIISLIIVGLSLFFAFGRHWWRRHRMRRSVREIDEVEAAAAALPTDPISALESHRADLRHRVASGRMSEDHFNFLDREIRRRLRLHRMHVLGPYLARMSAHYGRLLESTLDDGIVNDAERNSLLAALSRERRLKGPEKNELRRLITDWAGAAAWAEGRPKPKSGFRVS